MSENEDRTIVYVLGPSISFDMKAVRHYAKAVNAPLKIVGNGKRDLSLDEVKTAIKNARGEVTLIVAMHGNMSVILDKHELQMKDTGPKTSTGEFFEAVGQATGGKPVECLFIPCQSIPGDTLNYTTLGTGAEGAEREAHKLPAGSAICFLSDIGSSTFIKDADNMFHTLVEKGVKEPPTAKNLFDAYLTGGLRLGQLSPVLIDHSGAVFNPAKELQERLKKPQGARFNLDEFEAVSAMNRPDLSNAMQKINSAASAGALFALDPVVKTTGSANVVRQYADTSSWGDALYVAHVLSPDADGRTSDIKFVEPIKAENLALLKEYMAKEPPTRTLLGDALSKNIVSVAAKHGDGELLQAVAKHREQVPKKERQEEVFLQAAAWGNNALVQSTAREMGEIAPKLLAEAAVSIVEKPVEDRTYFRMKPINDDPIATLETLGKLGTIDWEKDRAAENSLLHKAIITGDKVAKFVLSRPEVDINAKGNGGKTLLMYAVENDCMASLENHKKVEWNAKDDKGNSALDYYSAHQSEGRDSVNPNLIKGRRDPEVMIKKGARLSEDNVKKLEGKGLEWYQNQVKLSDAAAKYHSSLSQPFTSAHNAHVAQNAPLIDRGRA